MHPSHTRLCYKKTQTFRKNLKYSPVTLQRRADGTVLLQAEGSPGESFEIQASADLQSWLDLGSVTANSNGLVQFDDTNASNYNARFYITTPQ